MVTLVTDIGIRKTGVYIKVNNANTNLDESQVVNLLQSEWYPMTGTVALEVVRISGSTDVVQVDLQVRGKDGKWVTVATVTSVTGDASTWVIITGKIGVEAKIVFTTVGSGNVLEAHALLN